MLLCTSHLPNSCNLRLNFVYVSPCSIESSLRVSFNISFFSCLYKVMTSCLSSNLNRKSVLLLLIITKQHLANESRSNTSVFPLSKYFSLKATERRRNSCSSIMSHNWYTPLWKVNTKNSNPFSSLSFFYKPAVATHLLLWIAINFSITLFNSRKGSH